MPCMSDIVIYVKLPRYEVEWCEYHFGSPCTFPSATNINNVIRHFLHKRPVDAIPEVRGTNEVAIVLPFSKSKDPRTFNYITKHGKAAIAEAIDDIFVMQMWEDLTDIGSRGVQVSKLIGDWMESNGIKDDENNYWNLRKKFDRIKEAYRNGADVNVSRGYKHN